MVTKITLEIDRKVSEGEFLRIKNSFKKHFGINLSKRKEIITFQLDEDLEFISQTIFNALRADNVMYLVSVVDGKDLFIGDM
ncbi:MAG: hypothetical protein VX028_03260 [Nanoarchaeota archaeon]|nr:hypothetical protein [Nanoarchaeota archaeon]